MDSESGELRYAGILSLLIACALFLAARVSYIYVADYQRFPINTIRITASYEHVTHKQLEKILDKYAEASFFSLPVSRLNAELATLAWVKKVQVERIWPDILKITIVEKIPIALWNNAWITEEGEVFGKFNAESSNYLSLLKGPNNQQLEVLQVYKKMSKILSIYGLQIASLELRDNHAWELILSNGVLLHLGKRDLEMRITRFCKAYPVIVGNRPEQLASVDLRYPRGLAVNWKK
jgi:cell division protein FtsQ